MDEKGYSVSISPFNKHRDNSNKRSQSVNKTIKLTASSLALAAFATVSLMGSAFSEETLKTYFIKTMPMNFMSKYPPSVLYSGDKDAVAFQVLNRTPRAIYFVHGDNKEYIPVVSENTVNLRDLANDGKYSIVDADGNTWFTGEVRPGTEPQYVVNNSTGNYDDWARQLAQFTSPDYVPKVEEYQQQDAPRSASNSSYRESNRSSNRNVRGYW